MKNTFFALLLLAPAGHLFAQDRHYEAPGQVQQSFQRDYPQAENPRWSQTHDQWHADFTDKSPDDRGEMVAHYDRRGRHIDSHVPYDQGDVPAEVTRRARDHYRGGRNYRYTRIERSGDQPALFQVRVNLNGRDRTTYLDENGRTRKYEDYH